MSGENEQFYKCHACGETKFCHDVSAVYEEVFDSKAKTVVEGKHYCDGENWACQKCRVKIPKQYISAFLSEMYKASER